MTKVVFNPFYSLFKNRYREPNVCLSINIFPNVWSQFKTNKSNFHLLEVVDRGSETQLQVGEN